MYTRIRRLRFRLFFLSSTNIPRQEIFIEHLKFTTTYSGPFYYDLICEKLENKPLNVNFFNKV